ncbi:unnamed protein product [Candida parapsilosis]
MRVLKFVSFASLVAYAHSATKQLNLFTRVKGDSPLKDKFDNKPIFFQTDPSGHYYLEVAADDSGLAKRDAFSVYTYDDEEQAIYQQITNNLRANLTAEDEVLQMTFLKPLVIRLIELKSGLLDKLLSFKEIAGLFVTENVPLRGDNSQLMLLQHSGTRRLVIKKFQLILSQER